VAGFGNAVEFKTQPSLGFCFDQFAGEMLLNSSQAKTLVDLQAELNKMALEPRIEDLEHKKVSQTIRPDLAAWSLDDYFSQNLIK